MSHPDGIRAGQQRGTILADWRRTTGHSDSGQPAERNDSRPRGPTLAIAGRLSVLTWSVRAAKGVPHNSGSGIAYRSKWKNPQHRETSIPSGADRTGTARVQRGVGRWQHGRNTGHRGCRRRRDGRLLPPPPGPRPIHRRSATVVGRSRPQPCGGHQVARGTCRRTLLGPARQVSWPWRHLAPHSERQSADLRGLLPAHARDA
jgi:hypothetical protein